MKTLEGLPNGKRYLVVKIEGGQTLVEKLVSINVRVGKEIKKVSSQPFRGPIIIDVDGRKYALGRGMALKILVDEK